MEVKINDKNISIDAVTTVAQVLAASGIETKGIAIAVNGIVLPKEEYAVRHLNDGDSIMIIKAFYGG